MWKSKFFTLGELTRSDTAIRRGINNTPTGEILERLAHTAVLMDEVRELLGYPIKVNSGYRSPELNAVVPGSSNSSAHTLGYAVDFVCPQFGNPIKICQFLQDKVMYDQIIQEYGADGWVHISFDPRYRMKKTIKNHGSGYVHVGKF